MSTPVPMASTSSTQTKEVVLGGVAFEASARSLVRKDCESAAFFVIRGILGRESTPTAVTALLFCLFYFFGCLLDCVSAEATFVKWAAQGCVPSTTTTGTVRPEIWPPYP